MMKRANIITTILAVVLIFSLQGAVAGGVSDQFLPSFLNLPTQTQSASSMDEISTNMRKLELLYRLVERDFLFDIDNNAVYEAMAKGLFSALDDPYSGYVIAKEATDFSEETTGLYGGIGAYISKNYLEYRDFSKPDTYMVNITSVFPGSPAELAGLRSGDLISHIDGQLVDDMEADQASRALKGERDTEVILTVLRGNATFDVTVIRKIVAVPTVSETILEGEIGYLRITQFTNSTREQVKKALDKFNAASIKALVLDLRDNPGGIVDATLSVADMLLSKEEIVHVYGKNNTREETYRASEGVLVPTTLPIAVLVNKGSASSSEILAGALKDNQRATLIGSTTFGKGLIQLVSPFGDGYYTLTTSQYRTPNGSEIHKVGIPVDIEVDEITVGEELLEPYTQFVRSNIIQEFVDKYPDYSEEHLKCFLEEMQSSEYGLPPELYRLLLRREYVQRIPYDDRPIAEPAFDPPLQRAIEFLTQGM